MTQLDVISLHKLANGQLQSVGAGRRALLRHPSARIVDEELISVATADGGVAWVSGAGPGSENDFSLVGIVFKVEHMTDELSDVVVWLANQGKYVICVWPPFHRSRVPMYIDQLRAAQASEEALASPRLVLVIGDSRPAAPAQWPAPVELESDSDLTRAIVTA